MIERQPGAWWKATERLGVERGSIRAPADLIGRCAIVVPHPDEGQLAKQCALAFTITRARADPQPDDSEPLARIEQVDIELDAPRYAGYSISSLRVDDRGFASVFFDLDEAALERLACDSVKVVVKVLPAGESFPSATSTFDPASMLPVVCDGRPLPDTPRSTCTSALGDSACTACSFVGEIIERLGIERSSIRTIGDLVGQLVAVVPHPNETHFARLGALVTYIVGVRVQTGTDRAPFAPRQELILQLDAPFYAGSKVRCVSIDSHGSATVSFDLDAEAEERGESSSMSVIIKALPSTIN